MRRGELVSDDVVVALVRERAGCLRCHGGFLLDGFPRTRAQAEALDVLLTEQGVSLDAVLSYELPLEEIVTRLGGRRTCPDCKAVYHVMTRPPRAEGVCDQCGADSCNGRMTDRSRSASGCEPTRVYRRWWTTTLRAGQTRSGPGISAPEEILGIPCWP
jgi:adenylate kinase